MVIRGVVVVAVGCYTYSGHDALALVVICIVIIMELMHVHMCYHLAPNLNGVDAYYDYDGILYFTALFPLPFFLK